MVESTKPVIVESDAGTSDAIQAAVRYLIVIISACIAIFGFLKQRDAAGLVAYIQANGGALIAAISGVVSVATALYGIYKTHKRGAQLTTVAADNRVPNAVAKLKK